jgi:MSHA biogenesis protein MshJ
VNERWRQLSAKFNALTLRERAIVLGGLIVAVIAVYDFLFLDPLAAHKRRAMQQLTEARDAVRTVEGALKTQEQQADPAAVKRSYRDALRSQIADIDKSMQGLQKGLVPPEQMAKLLESMLARSRGLALVSLRKLPVQRFETPGAPQAAAVKEAPQPERSIYQHSFELVVEGSYADLHDYLARLEKLPWQMFWGGVSVDAANAPRLTLKLTVHTLSLNKAWLIV